MRKVSPPVIAVLILIISLSIYGIYHYYSKPNSNTIEASGTIEATQVNIAAKLNGTLETINVSEGAEVEEGQILATLSRPDLTVQRERDLLNIEQAKSKLNDLISGARPEEIQAAEAKLNIAKENLEKVKTDLNRYETLYESGAISLQELENARLKLELAQNELAIAQANLNLLNAGPTTGSVEQATLEVERLESILKATNIMMEDLIIKSPLNGTVLSCNYEPGEYVSMGAKLFNIANLNDLWITVYIPSDELSQISLGQEVECYISGDSNVYKGKVVHVADKGEFTPKTIQTKKERANIVFAVKVSLDNENNRLKPGMPADVVFKRGE
ncbi:MAG: HlyD family efflux transporter periplasmic adaptor subunit [Syntrophomonadaceae bacterium]|nr:HlyD family efflux transporter periplasmic adaptor subunit [Syntrophomonadaceae bacterium]